MARQQPLPLEKFPCPVVGWRQPCAFGKENGATRRSSRSRAPASAASDSKSPGLLLHGLFTLTIPLTRRDGGHDLVRAGPDGGQAKVPNDALHGEDVRVPDAAHDLHGVMGGLLAGLGDELLGLRDEPADALGALTPLSTARAVAYTMARDASRHVTASAT